MYQEGLEDCTVFVLSTRPDQHVRVNVRMTLNAIEDERFVIAVARLNRHKIKVFLRRPINEGFCIVTDDKEQEDPPEVQMINKWTKFWYLGSSAIL